MREKFVERKYLKEATVIVNMENVIEVRVETLFCYSFEDKEILEKLEGWGVDFITKTKRRCYPGTDIEDGTRFFKEVASRSHSTRLETAEGPQYFRGMHSRQVKTVGCA